MEKLPEQVKPKRKSKQERMNDELRELLNIANEKLAKYEERKAQQNAKVGQYIKERRANDPEYKAKLNKNEYAKRRYKEDAEHRKRMISKSKAKYAERKQEHDKTAPVQETN